MSSIRLHWELRSMARAEGMQASEGMQELQEGRRDECSHCILESLDVPHWKALSWLEHLSSGSVCEDRILSEAGDHEAWARHTSVCFHCACVSLRLTLDRSVQSTRTP